MRPSTIRRASFLRYPQFSAFSYASTRSTSNFSLDQAQENNPNAADHSIPSPPSIPVPAHRLNGKVAPEGSINEHVYDPLKTHTSAHPPRAEKVKADLDDVPEEAWFRSDLMNTKTLSFPQSIESLYTMEFLASEGSRNAVRAGFIVAAVAFAVAELDSLLRISRQGSFDTLDIISMVAECFLFCFGQAAHARAISAKRLPTPHYFIFLICLSYFSRVESYAYPKDFLVWTSSVAGFAFLIVTGCSGLCLYYRSSLTFGVLILGFVFFRGIILSVIDARQDSFSRCLVYVVPAAITFYICKNAMKEYESATRYNFISKKRLEIELRRLELRREAVDGVLQVVLPKDVITRLQEADYNFSAVTESLDSTFCVFLDFFSQKSSLENIRPEYVLTLLNNTFCEFDRLLEEYPEIEKIKTISSKALLICRPRSPEQVQACGETITRLCLAALKKMQASLQIELQEEIEDANDAIAEEETEETTVKPRVITVPRFLTIGIAFGEIVAGIVGVERFCYDVYGDVVNSSSRMQSLSTKEGTRVLCTKEAYSNFSSETRRLHERDRRGAIAKPEVPVNAIRQKFGASSYFNSWSLIFHDKEHRSRFREFQRETDQAKFKRLFEEAVFGTYLGTVLTGIAVLFQFTAIDETVARLLSSLGVVLSIRLTEVGSTPLAINSLLYVHLSYAMFLEHDHLVPELPFYIIAIMVISIVLIPLLFFYFYGYARTFEVIEMVAVVTIILGLKYRNCFYRRTHFLYRETLVASRELQDVESAFFIELVGAILPQRVFNNLIHGDSAGKPSTALEKFENVSVIHLDVTSFTVLSSALTPHDVINMLNSMFTEFDQICYEHKVEKVLTIGDAYVAMRIPDKESAEQEEYQTSRQNYLEKAIKKTQAAGRISVGGRRNTAEIPSGRASKTTSFDHGVQPPDHRLSSTSESPFSIHSAAKARAFDMKHAHAAADACSAALEMLAVVELLGKAWAEIQDDELLGEQQRQLLGRLKVRIGIHSGLAWGCLTGGTTKIKYEIVGEAMEESERFEQVATPGTACCGSSTMQLIAKGDMKGFIFAKRDVRLEGHEAVYELQWDKNCDRDVSLPQPP
ncbi:Soluble guanylate cyclase gcy-31 [Phlyctochytrium bullatum]|nr:Soluble guanylate cyclase gcy-31 [Phlyctochytrium bullatum]